MPPARRRAAVQREPHVPDELAVRAPRQQRSRERWARVLDAGVELIEEGGYDALTIAAVCDRSGAPPRFLYERVASKEALFLAVYEHGMARVRESEAGLDDGERWQGLDPVQTASAAVRELARIFEEHHRLLRSIVLISSAHPVVRERGAAYVDILGRRFADRLRGTGADEAAIDAVFGAVFASLVFRTAYGDDFLQPHRDDDAFVASLVTLAVRTLRLG